MKPELKGVASRADLPSQPNQSLIGGMECLEMLVALRRPVGCRELARLLDMDPTRVNRLLKTLAALGMAERTLARQYQPGPGIHVLATMGLHSSNLLKVSLKHLPGLLERFPDLSIALGVLWRAQVSYLYYGFHGQPISANLGHSDLYPAEKSSIGQVLLAALPETEAIRSLRNRALPPFNTAQEPELRASFAKIKCQGYAFVNDKSLGVPVGCPPVAGLAASNAVKPEIVPVVLEALQEVAAKIAEELNPMKRVLNEK